MQWAAPYGTKPSREAHARLPQPRTDFAPRSGHMGPALYMGPDAGAFSPPRTRFARARVPRGPLVASLKSVAAVLGTAICGLRG
jgi:hypothetical protein